MSIKQPLVSVVMPAYNAELYVAQALESVLKQSHKNIEVIVIDDASTDQSRKILARYATKDPRITFLKNRSNMGVGLSTNRGIKACKGDYLVRMDADDVMHRMKIQKQLAYMRSHKNVVACGTFMREIDKTGKTLFYRKMPVQHNKIFKMMAYLMGIAHPTLMVDLSKVPSDFQWYRSLKVAEDLDLLFRLLPYGEFGNVSDYLHDYRRHGENMSLSRIRHTFSGALKVRRLAEKRYGYRPSLVGKMMQELSRIVLWLPDKWVYSLYQFMRSA